MEKDAVSSLVEQQNWADPVADRLQEKVTGVFESLGENAPQVKNFLHGTWLGHPLHPVLTDIPVGAWTAAAAFDVFEGMTGARSMGKAADAAITVGLVGAAGAAVTGVADWHATSGSPRRTGLLHAMLNTVATSLYVASCISRKSNARELGRKLALTGYLVAGFSAYLGGKLVYSDRIGVDHGVREDLPTDWTVALPEDGLLENRPVEATAAGQDLVLVKQNGSIFALHNRCAHQGGPLSQGSIDGSGIRCPWHNTHYSLETGEVQEGPSAYGQPCFETRVRNGQVEVRAVKA